MNAKDIYHALDLPGIVVSTEMNKLLDYLTRLTLFIFLTSCGGDSNNGDATNQPPTLEIEPGLDLSTHVLGDSIEFRGNGHDEEDGQLSESSLVWVSDLDGIIGTGTQFDSDTLSSGTHKLTLTGTDSESASSVAFALIKVTSESVETYQPANLARLSELYRVEVFYNGNWMDTGAYQYSRPSEDAFYHLNLSPWVHWTTLGVAKDTAVDVRVTRLIRPSGSDPFIAVEILPSRYNIIPAWTSDTIEFSIRQNQKVYVRTNDQDFDTLFIYANPLKPPLPSGAVYYGPGIHNIGFDFELSPSQNDVYLDGGAWVIGTFDITDSNDNVRIIGPGVLSGEFTNHEALEHLSFEDTFPYMMIHTENVDPCPDYDIFIKGITLVASPFFNVNVGCNEGHKRIDNLHIISPWTFNTDGIPGATNLDLTNSFIYVADDSVHAEYLYDGNILVSDTVLASGNSILLGYGYFDRSASDRARISNIDMILQDRSQTFKAEIDGRSSEITVDDQLYENIVIDGDVNQLFVIRIEDTGWGAPNPALGNVRNISFTDITVTGQQNLRSEIKGKNANNRIADVRIKNLSIGGTMVTSANRDLYFDIDESTVSINFEP